MGHSYREDPRFKFLVEGYKPRFAWWEAVVLSRKFFLSCVRILVQSLVLQGQLGVAILFLCAMAQARYILSFFCVTMFLLCFFFFLTLVLMCFLGINLTNLGI